jgi:hypothetical protein
MLEFTGKMLIPKKPSHDFILFVSPSIKENGPKRESKIWRRMAIEDSIQIVTSLELASGRFIF